MRHERALETSFLEENAKRYREQFQTAIVQLKADIAGKYPTEVPEYLGSGMNAFVFRIEVSGKPYAAKLSHDTTYEYLEVKPLLRAKGIPHTAQLASYSFADGVVITDLLPGKDVASFKPGTDPGYTDAHIIQLIETVRELDAHGLVIDGSPANFMYDPKQGFSVMDYHLKSGVNRHGLPQEILELNEVLTYRDDSLKLGLPKEELKKQWEARQIERCKIFLPMMIRFLNILKERYPTILADWQRQHEEDKKNRETPPSELIDREHIPPLPEFEPYLKKLKEMGF